MTREDKLLKIKHLMNCYLYDFTHNLDEMCVEERAIELLDEIGE